MLIHTDQKPYQCDHCYQSFRQKQLLKRHCNLYHNPTYVPPAPQEKTHQCPECERAFRHKGNLIRHMAVHDPESSVQEKQQALKIGRQKKIQIIDGQRVEVMTGKLNLYLRGCWTYFVTDWNSAFSKFAWWASFSSRNMAAPYVKATGQHNAAARLIKRPYWFSGDSVIFDIFYL